MWEQQQNMWGGSFQLCLALIIYKCAARRSWIRTWSWIFIQTWAEALEQGGRDVSDDWSDEAPLCVNVWRCDEETSPAAPPVLLVLLAEELSTSNSSSFVGRLWKKLLTDKLKSPVRRWPLVVIVIMTTAKKEVRWRRIQCECVQVSWRPPARYSHTATSGRIS